jgi:hypothetical protein
MLYQSSKAASENRNPRAMMNPYFQTSNLNTTLELAIDRSELNFCLISLIKKNSNSILEAAKPLIDLKKSTLEFFVK